MKRFIVLPVVALFLCCGCSKSNTVTPILDNISFIALIRCDEQEFTCDVTIADSSLKLVVNEPKQIDGLTININKNGITAEFMGVSYTPDLNSMPQGAVAQVLFKVLNDAANKEVVCDDENCEITGRVDGYRYDFTFSPSGLPLLLEIDDFDIKIKFNNVALK